MNIKRNTREPFVAILLVLIMALSVFSVMCTSASAATEDEIEASINLGVAWLLGEQNLNGSWGVDYTVARTGFALVKLEDRSRELGYEPLDPAGPYYSNISIGLAYLDSKKINENITADPADKNGNGNAVHFTDEFGFHETYSTGIALMAIANSGMVTPDVQDMVDWFIKYQNPDGGWIYKPDGSSDNSNTGYAALGLAYAETYGADIGDVKPGLDSWVDYIQNGPGVADDGVENDPDGGSGYTQNNSWVNILKTGNLIFEAGLVGDNASSPRVQNAVDYIVRHWDDPNSDPGLRPNHYQSMYATMKGLEYLQIDEIGGIDWFDNFSTVIVDTQNGNGSWPADIWGDSMLSTVWALLTLEKVTPPPPVPSIDIEKSTNGEDADVAPGPRIRSGREVTWTYNVTNNGTVILNNIIVIDDMLGEITCPSTTLQPGESMVCTAIGTAWVGQYSNLGTVTAVYEDVTSDNGETIVTDSDQSHYFGYKITGPNFEVPTANPFLTAGVLGIAIVFFLRRELK